MMEEIIKVATIIRYLTKNIFNTNELALVDLFVQI